MFQGMDQPRSCLQEFHSDELSIVAFWLQSGWFCDTQLHTGEGQMMNRKPGPSSLFCMEKRKKKTLNHVLSRRPEGGDGRKMLRSGW